VAVKAKKFFTIFSPEDGSVVFSPNDIYLPTSLHGVESQKAKTGSFILVSFCFCVAVVWNSVVYGFKVSLLVVLLRGTLGRTCRIQRKTDRSHFSASQA
jgi:hypothetical protein